MSIIPTNRGDKVVAMDVLYIVLEFLISIPRHDSRYKWFSSGKLLLSGLIFFTAFVLLLVISGHNWNTDYCGYVRPIPHLTPCTVEAVLSYKGLLLVGLKSALYLSLCYGWSSQVTSVKLNNFYIKYLTTTSHTFNYIILWPQMLKNIQLFIVTVKSELSCNCDICERVWVFIIVALLPPR